MNHPSPIPPDTPLAAVSPAPWAFAQNVLSEADLDGEVVLLGAGAERAYDAISRSRLLYIVAGSVTATLAPTNHMLTPDNTLVVAAKRTLTLRNHASEPAKVFLLTLPSPRIEWRVVA
jgi:glyoxylate utilization-related uncharacterized protein